MYFCASETTAASDAVPADELQSELVPVVPSRPAAEAADAQFEDVEVVRAGLMRKRAWISAIRVCTWLTPSTAPPRSRRPRRPGHRQDHGPTPGRRGRSPGRRP